jgi:hypothetical protein
MIGFNPVLDAPTTARYHRQAVEQITQCVEERIYCALLGPRLCGKTVLLRFIERNLAHLLGWNCVYVDLNEIRATTQGAFFADLTRLTGIGLSESTGGEFTLPDEEIAGSAVFRAFLSDCLETIDGDLVLLIDPLEALPTDLVQALLTSLRAAYMDQQTLDHQVTVVVSGALSLATLAVGESSPFRGIARRVFIGDLSEDDSQTLILDFLAEEGVNATRPAIDKMLQATSGDVYLMRRISQYCTQLVQSRTSPRLRSRDVTSIINRFLRDDVFHYAPLLEAVRLIEENPDLLQGILLLLEQESVPRSALPLPLSPDLDPLYLTGVVEKMPDDRYRVQNLIYRQFLTQHFSPNRVGRVLAMAGRWETAIDYLESSIQGGNQESRTDLIPATINSIYAAQDLHQAVYFLQRGLSAAFGIKEAHIWYHAPQEELLRLISPTELPPNSAGRSDLELPITADRLESRAYRNKVALRGQEEDQRVLRAIPLMVPGSEPVGVVTFNDHLVGEAFPDHRERDLQMGGFLNQATRALQTVSLRRQELALAGRVQASLVPEVPALIPGWQIAATWRPARETSGDFYDFVPLPNGRVGIVMADVVDKGMGAALLMALSRTLIRTFAAEYPDQPEQLLQVTNQRILSDIEGGLFVTLFYGILDPSTGELSYSNAGHPRPYLFIPGEEQFPLPLPGSGMPLGVSEKANWESGYIQIPAGGNLLLYTDGVLDAQNQQGQFFGEQGMLDIMQIQAGGPVERFQDALLDAIYGFSGAEPQVDDISIMILKRE